MAILIRFFNIRRCYDEDVLRYRMYHEEKKF
jgi:hypothetical protein